MPCNAEGHEVTVTKVIDGHTVVLENGDTVRYIGIEAPALKKNEGGPQFYAREAARRNKSLVLMKKVRLEYDVQKKDSRGRILAYVYVKKTFVNGDLVRSGSARAVARPPNEKYKNLFAKYERDARARCVGLWQEKKKESEEYYIGNKRAHVFHRPSCPLAARISEKNRIIFRNRTDPIKIGYVPCRKCRP
jgi:endonuclease YncB( thermonuclease family)